MKTSTPVCKPPLKLSSTKKYCVCSPKKGCPSGMTKNKRTGNCINKKHLKNGCPPGQILIKGVGQWEGNATTGTRCYNYAIDKCMPPLSVSGGNKKMKIPTWSIPRGATCLGKTDLCDKYCYANIAELIYPSVLPSRRRNLQTSKGKNFIELMVKEIKKKNPQYFRIHESGDFYSEQYRDKWYEIIRQCPEVKFLAYTKMCNWNWNKKPSNLNVLCSLWPDSTNEQKKSRLPKSYCIDTGSGEIPHYTYDTKGLLCPEQTYNTTHPEYHASCDKCKYCWEEPKPVIFELH